MARLFTLEEANELIPTLSESLRDLQAKRDELQTRRRELAALEVRARSDGREMADAVTRARKALDDLMAEMNDGIDRITALGCELKDLAHGLIDFPALRDGRQIYLCWRLGEERVAFWHDTESGFAGRQPL